MNDDYKQGYAACLQDILSTIAKGIAQCEAAAAEKALVANDKATYSRSYREAAVTAQRSAGVAAHALRLLRRELQTNAGLPVSTMSTGVHAEAESRPLPKGCSPDVEKPTTR
jgi:hypothetical protein